MAGAAGPAIMVWTGVGLVLGHQPFQEVPNEWNTRVDAFWQEIEAQA